MKITPTTVRAVVIGAFVGLLLTSCASEAVKAQAKKEKANKDQYVDYYPTGSNIPVKVPKDMPKNSESDTDAAQRAIRDLQVRGVRVPGDPETQAANAGSSGTR